MKKNRSDVNHSMNEQHRFRMEFSGLQNLKNQILFQIELHNKEVESDKKLFPEEIKINEAFFSMEVNMHIFLVSVFLQENQIILFCNCNSSANKLCDHQGLALHAIARQDELLVFF